MKKKLIVRECTCPVCGSSMVNYGSSDLNDNIMSYRCECNDCGATWNEDFALTFCGISRVYDKDGNQLGNVMNLKGEEECLID